MLIQFKNVMFDSNAFMMSEVNSDVLTIHLRTGEVDIVCATEEAALDAQHELGKMITDVNKPAGLFSTEVSQVAEAVETVIDSASSVVRGLFGTVKSSLQEAAIKAVFSKANPLKTDSNISAEAVLDELEPLVASMLSKLDAVMNPGTDTSADTAEEAKPVPKAAQPAQPAKQSADAINEAHDVFSRKTGTKSQSTSQDEVKLIADMTEEELIKAISDEVDSVIANNPRVRDFVEKLKEFNTEKQVQASIDSHKDLVLDYAKDNTEMTVKHLVASLLRNYI